MTNRLLTAYSTPFLWVFTTLAMDFQQWVQGQSVLREAPTFGDDPESEIITAQNGVLYDADEGGTAMYMVQLSVQFMKKYEVKNKWLT